MSAFGVELYRLGYRFHEAPASNPQPQRNSERDAFLDSLHVAKMPCPGSCGSVCPNHFCPAHNKQVYKPREPRNG